MINVNYFFIRHYDYQREIATHSHDCYEFVYYLSGEGETVIGNKTYAISKDCHVIILPHTPHSEKHYGYSSVAVLGFDILDEELTPEELYTNLPNQTVSNLVSFMRREISKKEPFFDKLIRLYASELLTLLVRNQRKKGVKSKNTNIEYALSYIDEYYMAEINLDEISASVGYCTDRFRNIFKSITGVSPKKYILKKRLELAEKLLMQTDKTLEEICYAVGFKYYSRFSIFFKEQTGLTPIEYRNKSRGET